ncbi:GerAB/ArcD/ProY family transporter [Paenibacillaceae sp. P-4]|uniref:GerAB/ArcD/ProY family transporter n=1 Tax=Paenibacillaceae bacterium P-4 TaxID=3160969 RepID=UPI0015807BAC
MSPTCKAWGVGILIYMAQRGVMFFQLPNLMAQQFGTNSWIMIPVFYLLSLLHIIVMYYGMRRQEFRSIPQLITEQLPKYVAVPLLTFIGIQFISIVYIVIHSYTLVFQYTNDTSVSINTLSLIVLGTALYCAWLGPYTMSKASIIFLALTCWSIGLELLQFTDFQIARLTPFIFYQAQPTAKGIGEIMSSFFGFELLMMMAPLLDNRTKWFRSVLLFNGFVAAYYLMYCLLVQGMLPLHQSSTMRYPVLRLYGGSRLTALENITDLLFIFMMFSAVVSAAMYIWSASRAIMQYQLQECKRPVFLLLGLLCALLLLAPVSVEQFNIVNEIIAYGDWILIFTLIMLYWILPVRNDKTRSAMQHEDTSMHESACPQP